MEADKCYTHLQGGSKCEIRELQACQTECQGKWHLPSVPRKVMEQIIPSVMKHHVQYNDTMRLSQQGFVKGRCCSINRISFCNRVTCLVDKEKGIYLVCLDFHKAFNGILRNIPLEKLFLWFGQAHWSQSKKPSASLGLK